MISFVRGEAIVSSGAFTGSGRRPKNHQPIPAQIPTNKNSITDKTKSRRFLFRFLRVRRIQVAPLIHIAKIASDNINISITKKPACRNERRAGKDF